MGHHFPGLIFHVDHTYETTSFILNMRNWVPTLASVSRDKHARCWLDVGGLRRIHGGTSKKMNDGVSKDESVSVE